MAICHIIHLQQILNIGQVLQIQVLCMQGINSNLATSQEVQIMPLLPCHLRFDNP